MEEECAIFLSIMERGDRRAGNADAQGGLFEWRTIGTAGEYFEATIDRW